MADFATNFLLARNAAEDRSYKNAVNSLALQQQQRLNALSQNPSATATDYARAGDPQTAGVLERIDAGKREQDVLDAQRAYIGASRASQSADPIGAARELIPDFVQQFDSNYGQGAWESLRQQPDKAKQVLGLAVDHAAVAAGIMPKQEPPSGEPLEAVVQNGKPVLLPRSKAAGLEPYYKPNTAIISNELSPEALQVAANVYRQTGTLPTLSRNPKAQTDILNEAARQTQDSGQSAAEAATGQATGKANVGALKKLMSQKAVVGAFEKTATKNLDLALQASAKVDRTGSPIINRGILAFKKGVTGDPDTKAFVNALTAARTEYAKVLSGATGATGITDAARRESEELFDTIDSDQTLQAVVAIAKQEMANRMTSFDDQAAEIHSSLSGKPAPSAQPQRTVVRTGTLNGRKVVQYSDGTTEYAN